MSRGKLSYHWDLKGTSEYDTEGDFSNFYGVLKLCSLYRPLSYMARSLLFWLSVLYNLRSEQSERMTNWFFIT